MKILIIGMGGHENRGELAILIPTIQKLRSIYPNSEIVAVSSLPETTRLVPFKKYKIRTVLPLLGKASNFIDVINNFLLIILLTVPCIIYRISKKKVYLLIPKRIKKTLEIFFDADLIISKGQEGITDYYGLKMYFSAIYEILLALTLRKKIVLLAHSIGPINNYLIKKITKIILSKINLIVVREPISKKFLENDLRINKKVHVTFDVGFLLKTPNKPLIKNILKKEGIVRENFKKPLVIIAPNSALEKRINARTLLKDVAEFCVNHLDSVVLLLPHVYSKDWNNDKLLCEKIYNSTRLKDQIKIMKGEYSAEELKGIIAYSDLCISSRFHPIIHSISTATPFLAVTCSKKTKGTLQMLGLDTYFFNPSKRECKEVFEIITEIWKKREWIKKRLRPLYPQIKAKVEKNFDLIKNIVGESNENKK